MREQVVERRRLVSYARNHEDLYVSALEGDRPAGSYVDCSHERPHLVAELFYEHGWNGLNIDADPTMRDEYRHRGWGRSVRPGGGGQPVKLVSVSTRCMSGWRRSTQKSSQCTNPAGAHTIDFLKIDVEGSKVDVLHGIDFEIVRSSVIVVEATRNKVLIGAGNGSQ